MKTLILVLLISICTTLSVKAYQGESFEVSGMSKTSYLVAAQSADWNANEVCKNNGSEGAKRDGEYRYDYAEGTVECNVQGVCRRRGVFFATGTYRCNFNW